jgi:hypothetical protein
MKSLKTVPYQLLLLSLVLAFNPACDSDKDSADEATTITRTSSAPSGPTTTSHEVTPTTAILIHNDGSWSVNDLANSLANVADNNWERRWIITFDLPSGTITAATLTIYFDFASTTNLLGLSQLGKLSAFYIPPNSSPDASSWSASEGTEAILLPDNTALGLLSNKSKVEANILALINQGDSYLTLKIRTQNGYWNGINSLQFYCNYSNTGALETVRPRLHLTVEGN